jgi:hypothetical protein
MKAHRFQAWLTTASLLTLASSGWAAPAVQQTPPPTNAADDAAEIAARRRAYEARQAAEHKNPAKDAAQGPQGTERALYEQEQAHRLRLGRIARLRTLLNARSDTEKLAKLDEIAAKEGMRYKRFTDIQRRKLEPEEAARVERQLAHGRQRGAEQPTSRETVEQRERLERERAERQRQNQNNKTPKSNPSVSHPKPSATPAGGR